MQERIIGTYDEGRGGPLFICFGGMHGNEKAGVKALKRVFELIAEEPIKNPAFTFCGRMVGLRGNRQALAVHQRFIETDLNRIITVENVSKVKEKPIEELHAELRELRELTDAVQAEIEAYQPKKLVILDLHTTTAFGGIFTLTTQSPDSEKVALGLHAPIVRGLLNGVQGTTLHYFTTENMGVHTVAITFESGQHDDPTSIDYAVSAIINCLRAIGCVPPKDIEKKHDNLLKFRSESLPNITELIHVHRIKEGDNFEMSPGFSNFQAIPKGTLLAYDKHGAIYAPDDALMLMPLYQKQGDDGFFLIKEVKK